MTQLSGQSSSRRPVLIDLFCKAGGTSRGYDRAGFEVVGVDKDPQPNYPYRFHRCDALDYVSVVLSRIAMGDGPVNFFTGLIAAFAASPPCQGYSDLRHRTGKDYPRLIAPLRALLKQTGLPYVIENVEGAPLIEPVVLCGTMFPGLRVLRHRLFEANFPIEQPAHPKHPLVFTHDKRKAHYGRLDQDTSFVQVTGGGNCTVANARAAMGIDWMTKDELNEAVPPAYTEHVGQNLRVWLAQRGELAA